MFSRREGVSMASYRVVDPEGLDEGIRVVCEDHGESETFQPGFRTVAFHCARCGIEVSITLENTAEWRDLGEMC